MCSETMSKTIPAISVIVPVYNVEKYLSGCLASILNQTFTDFEVICVDDGSTDNSIDILNTYAAQDLRIRIIRQKNQGVSVSRNNAIEVAVGKYIFFVDSDDYIAPQALEFMHRQITTGEAEVVCAGFYTTADVYRAANMTLVDYKNIVVTVFDKPMEDYFKQRGKIYGMVWNKLYRADILRNIRFIPGRLFEDEVFTILVMEACTKIAYMDFGVYYYFSNQQSISKRKIDKMMLDSLVSNAEFLCQYFKKDCKHAKLVKQHKVKAILSMCYKKIKELEQDKQKELLVELRSRVIQMKANDWISYSDFNLEGKLKLFRLLHLIG